MKRLILITALAVAGLMLGTAAFAQSANRQQGTKADKNAPVDKHQIESSLPALNLEGNNTLPATQTTADNVLWQRDVYRMVDLTIDQNAPLYFPPQPDGIRMNLFSTIFDRVSKGEMSVYDYIDGKEIFNDDTKVKFTELLDRFWIPYEVQHDKKNPKDSTVVVETADVPSNEVTLYYVKECYFLDQTNSSVRTKVLAFCPVLVREDETGEMRKYPLFWVPFESARNLLSQTAISINNNAASRMSVADYLTRRLYKGDIYKVYNLLNQNIMDYCKTPEEIQAEQERLEKELSEIGNSLWPVSRRDELAAEEAVKEAAKSAKVAGKKNKEKKTKESGK